MLEDSYMFLIGLEQKSDLRLAEDERWRCDFVLLRCFSHYGLRFQHASLREKPSRRFWDQPGDLFRGKMENEGQNV